MNEASRRQIEREAREGSAFQALLGYRLVEWEADRAVLSYAVRPEHLNRTGRLHGGVIATLLDTAAGFSGCFSPDPSMRRTTVTLSLTVNYVAPVEGGLVRAEGRRTGGGKSIFFAEVHLRDEGGRLLASGSGTFRYLREERVEA